MFRSFILAGECRSELNTEMRFLFASARVDGAELVRLDIPVKDDERENTRINGCVIKVLRSLKKENLIQFYANRESFVANSTEASFLINKYGDMISYEDCASSVVYVKI